ncbi:diguanylate cyclase [Kamptonema cortianum]|nr:diguanylate cyclase [Geitlerinema splendidum]MDK3157671.1 diguanylate cyclase [Kamptonema cortianum]
MAHERAIGTLHSIRRVNPVLIGVSLSCLFLAGAWLASFRSAVELRELVDCNIRLNLQRTAATASSLVNPNLHSKIRKPEDLSSPEYEVISEKLAELQKRRPDIAFVYTVIAREDDVYIVVDPTPPGDRDQDGVEDKSYVMDLYPEASDQLRRALRTGESVIESEPQTDRWGTFVSAYSPVFKEDGTLECVVGVDLRYETYLATLAQVQSSYRQWITVAFLISLIIGAVGTGGARRLRQVIALTIDQQETLNERNSQLAQMSDELFEQAHTDPLTGLDNRMAFEKFTSTSLQQLREQDEAIILLADIDHFKNINDTCGHEAGDSLIIECANRMRRYGMYDALARFGGDEFVAVFFRSRREGQSGSLCQFPCQRL